MEIVITVIVSAVVSRISAWLAFRHIDRYVEETTAALKEAAVEMELTDQGSKRKEKQSRAESR